MFVYIMIVAIFFALYFVVPQKYSAIPCVLFVVALAAMSFYVQPNPTDDLARYFHMINQIEKGGYEGFREMIETNRFDFVSSQHWRKKVTQKFFHHCFVVFEEIKIANAI